MTSCDTCPDTKQISNLARTICFSCKDGEEEYEAQAECVPCDFGKYSDSSTSRICVACRNGTYASKRGSAVCDNCPACPDSFYRANCSPTVGGGVCKGCPICARDQVRVDCLNRAGHSDQSGVCRPRKFMVRTALCDESGTGSGLGGYDFAGLFGMTQDSVPFQCRKRCDGNNNKMTLEMKVEPELAMYTNTNRSFDSGYCNGPFACDVHSCVIFTPSNDWDAAYMQASACPVYIDARLEQKLWATPDDPNLLDAIDSMRRTKCSSCDRCGHDSPSQEDSQAMQGYATWGVGCVRECSETLCGDDQVWDWTEADLWNKCKLCTALADVRLCLTKEQQYFVASDVSGNLPKIYFDGCHGKSTNTLTNRVEATYGTCVACPADDNLCASGQYYKTCGWDDEEKAMTAVCEDCRVTSSVTSYYFNGSSNRNVYCQKAMCGKDRTGVTIDVTPHVTCNRRCQTVLCVPGQVLLPCVLPHYARCVWAVHGDQHVQDLRYVAHAHSPGHANMLEPVDATNMFSSFENVLLSVDSVKESRRRVCVWNADDVVDNGMNPGGVSVAFDGECRPWSRDPATAYPLLPMQNTVIEREVTFYRRILLNTSACAAHYSSEWRGMPREYGKSSIPGAFSGDVFLDLDLTNTTNATLAAFVPDDRGLAAVTSISRWRVSIYAQQTLGDPSRVRIDTDTGIQICNECFDFDVTNCESGKYATSSGTSVCSSCPANSISPVGSTALTSCVCSAGFTGNPACLSLSPRSDNLQWSCGGRCGTAASSSVGQPAYQAIDGDLGSVSLSNNGNPWWRLDFGNTKTVTSVSTWAQHWSYMLNYKITVGESTNADENAICASGLTGDQTVTCSPPLTGRYLHISQASSYLVIKEVIVSGFDGVCPVVGCNACPAGTYKSSNGSSVCTSCAAGVYSNVVGATSCHTTSTPAPVFVACLNVSYVSLYTTYKLAWSNFNGDKFLMTATNSTYVCDKATQERIENLGPPAVVSHHTLAVLAGVVSELTDPTYALPIKYSAPERLIGSSGVISGLACMTVVYSSKGLYCLSVEGVITPLRGPDAVISALCDVVQSVVSQSDSILATYTCGDTRASLCFNLSSQTVTSFEDRDDIVMHASVVPEYYLSRNDNGGSIVMKAFRCSNVCALQCTSDEVSRRIELSFSVTAANTFFSGNKQIVVLATSARNADAGVTYVFMARQGVVSKYTLQDRGSNVTEDRDWTPDGRKMRENAMSGAWIAETTFVLSFEDPRMIWQCTVDYSSITVNVLKPTVGSPQLPFFRVGSALLSYTSSTLYTLQTWMPACKIETTDTSAYFAFGSAHLNYTRLRPCGDGIHYIDPPEWTSAPVHTCASSCWNSALLPTEYQVAMRCKTPDRVSIMSLTLPTQGSVTFDEFGITNTAAGNETVVVYTQCRGLQPSRVFVAGGTRCAGVCEIRNSSRILLAGGVSITFVVETKMQPTSWQLQAMLGGSVFWSSAVESLASHGQWSQPHVFVHNIHEKQPIFVNVVRTVRYESLVDTLTEAEDTETNVALDVLEVIPTLSERAVFQVWNNRTLLFTVLRLPSDDDLALLSLQAFKAGHDVLNWRRLHAVAYIRSRDATLAGCVYDLRLIEVDASFVPSWPGPELGCAVQLPGVMEIMTAQCHLEIPYAMANTVGLVGMYVSSADGQACPLPHPESLSLELAPFVALQNCTQDAYLHAGTGKCVSCESSDKKCGVGFYAPACEALLPASRPVNCSACPAVANSVFLPTSANCDDWTCLGGFYNSDGTCIACTSDLVHVCGRTAGLNWSACTTIRNEDCRACDDLRRPRYADWTNHSTCSWRCRDAYFESDGQCYACMSLDMLKVVLEFGGDRSADTFYKFEPCNASHQSRFTPCVQSYLGNGAYTADAAAFLQHCPARCAEDHLVHLVATSYSDSDGLVWDARQCVLCAQDDLPTFPNGSMLPAHAFSMNLTCHAACLPAQGFYAARNRTRARCVHCPDTKCAVGEYLSTSDDCSDCRQCASRLRENVVFTSSGRVDAELSCAETCEHGYFYEGSRDTCLPHANKTCTLGLEYKVNGTAFADTRCVICTDCLGKRERRACSAHEDAECDSCGELVWWNSHWSGVDCHLECKPSFTKLFGPERCQQCSMCPEGSSRPPAAANCSHCLACEPPKPESASYLQECTWRCPDFYSLVQTNGISQCLYAPGWITSDSVAVEPPATELVCAKGFRLENFACTQCDTPAGLSNATLGDTWFWVTGGCAWECTPERSHFTDATTKTHSCLSVPAYRQAVLRQVAWRKVKSETGETNASSGDTNTSQNTTAAIQESGGNGSVALVLFSTGCALLCVLSCFSLRVRHRYGKLK